MREGAPDELVERVARIPPRNDDVDEWIAVWRARRPAGAARVVRVLVENAPPRCYTSILPTQAQDPAARTFAPWSAIRTGRDDDGRPWSIAPHQPGVNAAALLDVLGDGTADTALVVHVTNELADALEQLGITGLRLEMYDGRVMNAFDDSPSALLVRPVDLRHVTFCFDGSVALDVVTDRVLPERHTFDATHDDLRAEETAGRARAWALTLRVLDGLGARALEEDAEWRRAHEGVFHALRQLRDGFTHGDRVVALGAHPLAPEGRARLRGMLSTLFPAELRRTLDIEESAALRG